jgi:hypothetical protein
MERAHYSYYALLPQWDLYNNFDNELARLNPHVFLLWIPEGLLKSRSLLRLERQGWSDGFLTLYGSESAALGAVRASQNARYEAIQKSAIPNTVIDTAAMEWERYANCITSEMQKR